MGEFFDLVGKAGQRVLHPRRHTSETSACGRFDFKCFSDRISGNATIFHDLFKFEHGLAGVAADRFKWVETLFGKLSKFLPLQPAHRSDLGHSKRQSLQAKSAAPCHVAQAF